MPKRPPKNALCYIAAESFVANVDGIDKSFHEGRTRVYEGDPILDRTPDEWWVLLEDHRDDAA